MSETAASVSSDGEAIEFRLVDAESGDATMLVDVANDLLLRGYGAEDVAGLLAHLGAAHHVAAGGSEARFLELCRAVWQRASEQISEIRRDGDWLDSGEVQGRA